MDGGKAECGTCRFPIAEAIALEGLESGVRGAGQRGKGEERKESQMLHGISRCRWVHVPGTGIYIVQRRLANRKS